MTKIPALRQFGPLGRRRSQRGVATLLVVLSILVILTIIILASSNVALFEQKTSTNENRQKLAEQAAEYALGIGGEYLKANVSKLSTNVTGGWLNGASLHWKSCAGITDTTHVCFAEPRSAVRDQLYYYTSDGNAHTNGSDSQLNLFNQVNGTSLLPTGSLTTMGGTAAFPATATVKALLCRVNAPTGSTPACNLTPTAGRQIAVTLVSEGRLTNENASAVVKETWGTITKASYSAAVPLVASGFVEFIGSYTVVAAPNAAGTGSGVAASVWSPNDAGGNGSYQTCSMDDYLGGRPSTQLGTNPGCAVRHACNCDVPSEIMSTKALGDGEDILDVDSNTGPNPDITFFPGKTSASSPNPNVRMDYRVCTGAGAPYTDCVTAGDCPPSHPDCKTDDNLFEWIFGTDTTGGDDNVTDTTCAYPAWGTVPAGNNCEVSAMHDKDFQAVADCSSLGPSSSGSFYVTGACALNGVYGSPDHPVILVVNDEIDVGHADLFYGMIFVRDQSLDKSTPVSVDGVANGTVFGSMVVEGDARLRGTMDLVYMDTSAGSSDDPLPDSTRFARLPGSWLDNMTSF